MPELTVVEKLQPCLLDRLTDDDPKKLQESRAERVISIQRYRQGVLRDLQWLFNASAHLQQEGNSGVNLEDYPAARQSVINFGTRHLFGVMTPDIDQLERQLRQALHLFEPRIMRNTLKIYSRIEGNMIALEVDGDLWAIPMPEHLHIKTMLDLESGKCSLGG